MTRRWEVVRQTASSKRTVSTHRFEAVADLHRWWQDVLQRHRGRRSIEAAYAETGVFYTVLPAGAASRRLPLPAQLPWGRRCVHGAPFLSHCEDCPGGNPVIPGTQTGTGQPEAVET